MNLPGWASLTHCQFHPSVRDAKKRGRVTLWSQDGLRAQTLLPLALAFSVAERKKAEALEDGKYLLHGWGFSSGPPLYTAMMLPASPFLDLNVLIRITEAVKELNSGILLHRELIMWLHCETLDWLGISLGIVPKAPSAGSRCQVMSTRVPLWLIIPFPLPHSQWSHSLVSLFLFIVSPGHSA